MNTCRARSEVARRSPAVLAIATLLAAAGAGQKARAQTDEQAANVAAARALAIDGVKSARAGRCDLAVDKLERAEALHHAPVVVTALGECYIAQGRLVAGTELLRTLLREPLPPNAGSAVRKAFQRAQELLGDTTAKLATLTIAVSGPEQAAVTIDGAAVPPALIGVGRPTDPGEHTVAARASGYREVETKVALHPGERRTIAIELEPDPLAKAGAEPGTATASAQSAVQGDPTAAEVAAPSERPAEPRTSATRGQVSYLPAYASWAVAAVAIAMGSGFGVAAIEAKADLDRRCDSGRCPDDARDELEGAQLDATISSVTFTIGAAAAALGTVLYFIADQQAERAPVRAASARSGWRPESARRGAPGARLDPFAAKLLVRF